MPSSGANPFSDSVPTVRIHHLALRTADVGKLVSFYAGILGLAVVESHGTSANRHAERAWLSIGDGVLMIERRDVDEPAVVAGTKELIAFAVSADEREAFVERLANAGTAIEARTEHTLYFRDPDGRRVGVSSYPL